MPRPLFEAALRVLKAGSLLTIDTPCVQAVAEQTDLDGDDSIYDTAERIIRRAAACGVGEEG